MIIDINIKLAAKNLLNRFPNPKKWKSP